MDETNKSLLCLTVIGMPIIQQLRIAQMDNKLSALPETPRFLSMFRRTLHASLT
jgi:hypothetical protein